jgi:hypothetical protein
VVAGVPVVVVCRASAAPATPSMQLGGEVGRALWVGAGAGHSGGGLEESGFAVAQADLGESLALTGVGEHGVHRVLCLLLAGGVAQRESGELLRPGDAGGSVAP